MACAHGCTYCDGRAERYYVEGEFDRDIVVRENVPFLLEKEIPRLRERGFISLGSGVSDVYQPAERELELTRRSAEILAGFQFPVTVMTKSSLALRDIEEWSEVNHQGGFLFIVSLTFTDDSLREQFEPGASPVAERLRALRTFKSAGCHTGVLAMPLLPFISDTQEAMEELYRSIAAVGADFLIPGGLTLRPGAQKQHYMQTIERVRPDLVSDYDTLYAENRPSGAPLAAHTRELESRAAQHAHRHGLPAAVPHRIYRTRIHIYDELQVLMAHMAQLYDARKVDTRPLLRARARYLDWLTKRKARYNRRPSTRYSQLDDELLSAFESDRTADMIANDRLYNFLKRVVIDRCTFDYTDLSLSQL